MANAPAAIVLFAYKRVDHLRRCIESLASNVEASRSHLYIYCDGARTSADTPAVENVRKHIKGVNGFASVTPVLRQHNVGLSRSIIEGVTEVLKLHDRLIVVEDDLLLSPYFLRYMNQALNLYQKQERIASVHGYCYPVRDRLPETFFLRGADCWGWATWRRAWTEFRDDGQALLMELRERNLTHSFDLDGAYPFTQMLANQVAGRNDSWAIRWHAATYLKDMLTLYPGRSLVRNIGNDSSGTHAKNTTERFDVHLAHEPVEIRELSLMPNTQARQAFIRFLRPSVWGQVRRVAGTVRNLFQG